MRLPSKKFLFNFRCVQNKKVRCESHIGRDTTTGRQNMMTTDEVSTTPVIDKQYQLGSLATVALMTGQHTASQLNWLANNCQHMTFNIGRFFDIATIDNQLLQ